MRFQPGQSGNPAGRPPGSLNKRTIVTQALLEEQAEEVVRTLRDRAKNGDMAAMRLYMDRLAPTGRNRAVAINLPSVKTPEDAEAALTVVLAELADGKLTIDELSALITAIDRMVRLAERIWNFARNRRYAAARDAILLTAEAKALCEQPHVQNGAPEAPTIPAKPQAPLYSPVNSPAGASAEGAATSAEPEGAQAPGAGAEDTRLPRAA